MFSIKAVYYKYFIIVGTRMFISTGFGQHNPNTHIKLYALLYHSNILFRHHFFKTWDHGNILYNRSPYYFYVIETLRSNFHYNKQAGTSFSTRPCLFSFLYSIYFPSIYFPSLSSPPVSLQPSQFLSSHPSAE